MALHRQAPLAKRLNLSTHLWKRILRPLLILAHQLHNLRVEQKMPVFTDQTQLVS